MTIGGRGVLVSNAIELGRPAVERIAEGGHGEKARRAMIPTRNEMRLEVMRQLTVCLLLDMQLSNGEKVEM